VLRIENYINRKRFNEQYEEIYRFLAEASDYGYNEHFHWGRFEWMMNHSMLDEEKLEKIAIFRDDKEKIIGMITCDTSYEDRNYLIHLGDDEELLRKMIEYLLKNDEYSVKVNEKDTFMIHILAEYGFIKKNLEEKVLEIKLNGKFEYQIPTDFTISSRNFDIDNWKYQMVIHRGFDHDGLPAERERSFFNPSPNYDEELKIFIFDKDDYCAHCGIWYTEGRSAYIEPVVTIPRCRNLGLAKAAVYEGLNRVKESGAERAIVLSDQEFYHKIGFAESSGFYCWSKK